jgi:hypothetical protein
VSEVPSRQTGRCGAAEISKHGDDSVSATTVVEVEGRADYTQGLSKCVNWRGTKGYELVGARPRRVYRLYVILRRLPGRRAWAFKDTTPY